MSRGQDSYLYLLYYKSYNLVARARDPRGGIVRLWENAEKNQSSIGCFIITQTQKVGID